MCWPPQRAVSQTTPRKLNTYVEKPPFPTILAHHCAERRRSVGFDRIVLVATSPAGSEACQKAAGGSQSIPPTGVEIPIRRAARSRPFSFVFALLLIFKTLPSS